MLPTTNPPLAATLKSPHILPAVLTVVDFLLNYITDGSTDQALACGAIAIALACIKQHVVPRVNPEFGIILKQTVNSLIVHPFIKIADKKCGDLSGAARGGFVVGSILWYISMH
jgi:hypothetical protein